MRLSDDSDSDLDAPASASVALRALDLGHLRNCTRLTPYALCNTLCPLEIRHEGDVLPPNLQQLQCKVAREEGAMPLLQLSALTGLTLIQPQITKPEIWELLAFCLTQLDRLALVYSSCARPDCTRHGWGGLPVKSITVRATKWQGAHEMQVHPATVSALASVADSLTELHLEGHNSGQTCKIQGLLRSGSLIETIGTLPRLSDLRLSLPNSDKTVQRPAAVLAAGGTFTRLTAPSLSEYLMSDFAVCVLACALTGLRHLDLSSNAAVSNAVLPVIAVQLPQLTALHLAGTRVTTAGLEYFTRLEGLRVLGVSKYSSAGVRERAWAGSVSIVEGASL